MARGNCIRVSCQPGGRQEEGYASGAMSPGMVVQQDPTVALREGRHTYKVYQPGVDGENPLGAIWVVEENYLLGQAMTAAYASGDRIFLYCPQDGDELNMLIKNLAGTGDDHTAGEKLMIDHGTGMLIATTGTPENEPFLLLESITDPVADTLAWCRYGR